MPTHHSHTVLEVLANAMEQEKETKGIQIVEDKIKLFKGVMIAANMKDSKPLPSAKKTCRTKKRLYRKVEGYKTT